MYPVVVYVDVAYFQVCGRAPTGSTIGKGTTEGAPRTTMRWSKGEARDFLIQFPQTQLILVGEPNMVNHMEEGLERSLSEITDE